MGINIFEAVECRRREFDARSEGPSWNSHGREAVESGKQKFIERRRCDMNSRAISFMPALQASNFILSLDRRPYGRGY
jgi:hypothetical protein